MGFGPARPLALLCQLPGSSWQKHRTTTARASEELHLPYLLQQDKLRDDGYTSRPSREIPSTSRNPIPSPKLTWKLLEGPIWRIVVFFGAPLHFHVNLGECRLWTSWMTPGWNFVCKAPAVLMQSKSLQRGIQHAFGQLVGVGIKPSRKSTV